MSNGTCKECIHYAVCVAKGKHANYQVKNGKQYLVAFENPVNCKHFKDRSKFVDASELQQNVIRPLTNRCAAYTKCQTCLACALEIRERCDHHKKAEQALKEREEE